MCTYAYDVPLFSAHVCLSVQDVIDRYFTSQPPGLPAAPSPSGTDDDVTSEVPVSDVNEGAIQQSICEFAMLLLRCLSCYIKVQQGTLNLHLLTVIF